MNYYQTCVVEYNDINGVGSDHTMNNTGKKGTAKVQGVPGLYKKPQNEFLPTTDFAYTTQNHLQTVPVLFPALSTLPVF